MRSGLLLARLLPARLLLARLLPSGLLLARLPASVTPAARSVLKRLDPGD